VGLPADDRRRPAARRLTAEGSASACRPPAGDRVKHAHRRDTDGLQAHPVDAREALAPDAVAVVRARGGHGLGCARSQAGEQPEEKAGVDADEHTQILAPARGSTGGRTGIEFDGPPRLLLAMSCGFWSIGLILLAVVEGASSSWVRSCWRWWSGLLGRAGKAAARFVNAQRRWQPS
jgi:hypothetical protein